jgi:DNA topoisomerase-6 subunit B
MLKFEEISPSDFFYRNKEIAGFENSTKTCYTIVRELTENSLDSCEAGGILPNIYVYIKNLDENSDKEEQKINIRVEDNGIGVPSSKVPYAFGKILYGSKFVLKQHRGIFGLGGKMAVLYGQITTNTPFRIITSTVDDNRFIHFYEMLIDIVKNQPKILKYEKLPNNNGWHGLIIDFNFLGNYKSAKKKIIDYLFQTAIIVPYLQLLYVDFEGTNLFFERKVSSMPPQSKEVLYHPKGVDLEILRRMIKSDPQNTVLKFLVKRFQKIGFKTAIDILSRAHIDPNIKVSRLKEEELQRLYELMKSYPFKRPDSRALSPIGEYLKVGINEMFKPEFISFDQREPSSYEGHPFIVETAIAYGGGIPLPQEGEINLFRFANKIPLIYDSYNDVSMKVIKEINWNVYKINIYQEPVAFFVHICSTKIPYKTLGKEYIANQPEIYREIELSLRKNARNLSSYLNKKRFSEYQRERKKYLSEYIEKIVYFAGKLAEIDYNKLKNYLESFREKLLKENYEDLEIKVAN